MARTTGLQQRFQRRLLNVSDSSARALLRNATARVGITQKYRMYINYPSSTKRRIHKLASEKIETLRAAEEKPVATMSMPFLHPRPSRGSMTSVEWLFLRRERHSLAERFLTLKHLYEIIQFYENIRRFIHTVIILKQLQIPRINILFSLKSKHNGH